MISYFLFPDEQAGARRIDSLAELLPRHGWSPVVVTFPSAPLSRRRVDVVHTGNPGPLVERWWQASAAPSKGGSAPQVESRSATSRLGPLRTLGRRFRPLMMPDGQAAWGPLAAATALQVCRERQVDALFTTGPPHTAHVAGRFIKRMRPSLPWAAELRDPWSNGFLHTLGPTHRFAGLMAGVIERATLRRAERLIAVSAPHAEDVAAVHQREVAAIPTGVSLSEVERLRAIAVPGRGPYRIVHAGSLLGGLRDPRPVLRAVRRLVDADPSGALQIDVDFYGPRDASVDAEIARLGLSRTVRQHGPVSREIVLAAQAEADLLLMPTWPDRRDLGSLPSKLYEYIAVGKPILATGLREHAGCRLILELSAGVVARTDDEVEAALKQFIATRGQFSPVPIERLRDWSREGAAASIARVLDDISTQHCGG